MGKPIGDLTEKEAAFVENFLSNGFNATKAARDAGYAHPNVRMASLKKKPAIKARIEKYFAEIHATTVEVLARLAEQSRGDHSAYIQPDGTVDIESLVADGKGHLIKKITPTRNGLSIEFVDSLRALELIGKTMGLFKREIEISGPGGGPIEMVALSKHEELRRLQAQQRLLEKAIEEEQGTD